MSKDLSSPIAVEHDVRPCKHMEEMVSGFADGSLQGPAQWYTRIHMLYCTPCAAAAKNLRVLIGQISRLRDAQARGAGELTEDRREEIARGLDNVDASFQGKD